MVRYEVLMLSVPEITQDEAKTIESQLDRAVKGSKGTMISFERWGKYRLSYPIAKNDYGIYFLARFEVAESAEVLNELKTVFTVKLNDIVMRNMVSRLDVEGSLVYARPQSLEEAPVRDVDKFLRENKMQGLIKRDRHAPRTQTSREAAPAEKSAPAEKTAEAEVVATESTEGAQA